MKRIAPTLLSIAALAAGCRTVSPGDLFRPGFNPSKEAREGNLGKKQDVTERLRISEGTFFNYFPTKAAVLDAAAVDVLDRATVLLHHDVADHARAVLARLEELVRDFAANFAGDRDFAAQLALHTRLGLGREREQQTHRLLAELVEEGQRRGEIRADVPARRLAELFMAVVLVTVSNWLQSLGLPNLNADT